MPSQIVTVASTVGLHARPASLLVKAAAASKLSVTIGRPGEKPMNAASLLMVLALGVKCGESVEINVPEDVNAQNVLDELIQIITTDHDE